MLTIVLLLNVNLITDLPERHKIRKSSIECLSNKENEALFRLYVCENWGGSNKWCTVLNSTREQTVFANPCILAGFCASIMRMISILCNLCGNSCHFNSPSFSSNRTYAFETLSPHSQNKNVMTIDQKARHKITTKSI